MGLFRLMLAFTVVVYHYRAFFGDPTGSDFFGYLVSQHLNNASKLNCFFILGGFYTQFMLEEMFAHVSQPVKKFYIFRFLRLYPIYHLTLIMAVLVYAVYQAGNFPHDALHAFIQKHPQDFSSWQFWFDNIVIFIPQTFKYQGLIAFEVEHHLLIIPAWTLAVEIPFLIIAPFILRQKKYFWGSVAASVVLAAYYYFWHDKILGYWGASFIYFMLGCILYKFQRRYLYHIRPSPLNVLKAYILVAALTVFMAGFYAMQMAMGPLATYILSMIAISLSIPLLAAYTHNVRFDRYIGEFVYPVYVSHGVFITLASMLEIQHNFIFITVCCMVYAYVACRFVDQPLRRWRHKKWLIKSG